MEQCKFLDKVVQDDWIQAFHGNVVLEIDHIQKPKHIRIKPENRMKLVSFSTIDGDTNGKINSSRVIN